MAALCRGYFNVNGSLADANGMLPDTYMNVGKFAWAKGVAFINGFNLVRTVLPILKCSGPYVRDPVSQGSCSEEGSRV